METILWHDYETFGANPAVDRPSQFAAIRTDLELNIVGEPIEYFCAQADDYLPHPEACLVTGITPQDANREGYVEAEFIKLVHEELSAPLTCVAGYNSIRFDDEVTRHTLYRNFYDPYAREWQHGNSRWDIIDLVRLVYAVSPSSILWPEKEPGTPSFRLEELTNINGIHHESAHDAMSDVYATIALAKLIKLRCPNLYKLAFDMKDKRHVKSLFDIQSKKPVFHVSSKFPASLGSCSVVVPLAEHPVNSNGIICYDLRVNPQDLIDLSIEEIRERLFTSTVDLATMNKARVPLKVIHANKCPIIAPMSLTTSIPKEHLSEKLQLNGDTLKSHLKLIREKEGLAAKVSAVFTSDSRSSGEITDPEQMLYSGGFFGQHDKQLMGKITNLPSNELMMFEPDFQDERLPELFFRYKARNYPHQLTEDEHERWEQYRARKLAEGDESHLSFSDFFNKLQHLAAAENLSKRDALIIEDLKLYAESIMPYS